MPVSQGHFFLKLFLFSPAGVLGMSAKLSQRQTLAFEAIHLFKSHIFSILFLLSRTSLHLFPFMFYSLYKFISEVLSMLYKQICAEYQRITKQIISINKALSTLPPGFIFITRNGKYFRWYHSLNKVQTYIPKKNRSFAVQLASKKYLSCQLSNLLREKKAIESYLKYHKDSSEALQFFFSENSGYKDLLNSYFKPTSQELQEWIDSPYEQNPTFPEQLIHKSISGNFLRSKSESLIDTLLFYNHLPFRYEAELKLGHATYYPDFTIRHPKSGETIYWEHFGLMDDSGYCQKSISKLQFYALHGIIPSINLITTFETQNHPLSVDLVDRIINYYFL